MKRKVEVCCCDRCERDTKDYVTVQLRAGTEYDGGYNCWDPIYVRLDLCRTCVQGLLQNMVGEFIRDVEDSSDHSDQVRKIILGKKK